MDEEIEAALMRAGAQINALQANERRLIDDLWAAKKDAARWQQFRAMVGATRTAGYGGPAAFTFPSHLGLPPIGDIMRGSVAQHLDAAVDAVISERGAVGAA